MADLFTTLTDKAVLDASQVEDWKEGVILSANEVNYFNPGSPLISQQKDGDSSVATFIKYANLTGGTTELTDGEEVTSEAIVDSEVNITLKEYGNVVTNTKLAEVVTAGRLDPATAILVGKNMGESMEKLAIQTLEGATNELTVNASGEGSTIASNILTDSYFDKAYNKLRRAKIPTVMDRLYVAVLHPDVILDLKEGTSAGDWYDLNKYTDAEIVNSGRIEVFKGFVVLESANVSINADAGNGNVDTYHSIFMGYNALGMARSNSAPPQPTFVGETDKLNRFAHFGWYGIFNYGIIDSSAVWLVTSASSVGNNSA
jgi:N4-gp56 family major capsid protein